MVKNKQLHIFSSILAACLFSLFFTSPAFAYSGTGSGTSGDPYQITTCSQLHEIASNLSADYLLKNDVNCTGNSFTPIGDTTSNFFVGQLDGGGHKITNLTINSDENGVGIFEEVGTGGVITNIGYESGSVTSGEDSSSVGSFAGRVVGGSITKSYSKASIDGSAFGFIGPNTGGLFGGGTSATVSDSYYSGNVKNASGAPNETGGIAAYMTGGSITNSYTTGSLSDGQKVGGIVGVLGSSATIVSSFTTMTFSNDSTVGAIVGQISSGTISSSYWNDTSGGFFTCYFGGNTGCTRITNNIPYFYTVSNAPMSSWDFTNTWSTVNNGSNYPLLYWQSPNPTPTPTPTATPNPTATPSPRSSSVSPTPPKYVCSDAAPNASPDLFQIDVTDTHAKLYFAPVNRNTNKYYISFGYTPGDMRFGGELAGNSTGVRSYTINALSSKSTYYVRVRAGNGCATGGWSNEMKFMTTPKGNTNGQRFFKDFPTQVISSVTHVVSF